jgi:DNA-binding Lrp family transcriptional regulator
MPAKELRTPEPLDAIDRKLVALLRADARTPNSRLAEQAGIAPSTCVTRVRGLVERGVITGFTATIDADAVGVGLQALISIAIRAGARHEMAAFADEMRELADVVQLFFLGGSEDFIVHIAVRDPHERGVRPPLLGAGGGGTRRLADRHDQDAGAIEYPAAKTITAWASV